ncbi:FliC/FljB family flagellin [Pantoea sp. X85]|jgi:flagellin|uniref:FliC/FljB family flagellin n=1 Tax=Pantoea sp. X85 TaxID=3037258 RepID=UPI0024136316|nr:FliC/FljB family flagellin [Pantoea sp. X85]WFL66026.1 FliC/FljB family flagellin [Pantoea sp. X85]
MAQVINTNSLSLITQNNINKNQSAMSTAIERLSSGLRINSAKDDAAGQAIANRFQSNINGLTQAARNANDGISAAQTTEGALSEINNNLQRVRELTVQSQNGTNSQSDLDSIQDEIKSRLDEIDRVSGQTTFNGVNVLAKDGSMKIQVGANDGETITIDLKKIDSSTLNLSGFNVNGKGGVANTVASATDMTAAGFTLSGSTYTGSAGFTAASSANVLSSLTNTSTVTTAAMVNDGLSAAGNTYKYNSASNSFTFDEANVTATKATSYLNPTATDTTKATVTIGTTKQDVIIAQDGSLTAADDGAVLYRDTTGNLTKNSGGATPPPAATLANLAANTGSNAATIATSKGTLVSDGTNYDVTGATISADALKTAAAGNSAYTTSTGYSVSAAGAVTVTSGGAAVYADNKGGLTTNNTANYYVQDDGTITNGSGKVAYKDAAGKITTDAQTATTTTADPLKALDAAISDIDKFRSSLGAIQNRLDSAVTNLNDTTTNLSEAQSRIQDADYATEVSNMSKAQIVQQAGNSVLAKANQVPQQVLSLLQG